MTAFLSIFLAAVGLLATTGCESSPPGSAGPGTSGPTKSGPAQPDARAVSPNPPRLAKSDLPRFVEHDRFTIPSVKVNDVRVHELSGLAWDEDEQLLYAVTDKGNVIHFRLKLKGNTILAIEPVYAAPLVDAAATSARRGGLDAEGLAVLNADNGKPGDTELVVVVEGATPRILRFSPAGAMLGELPVPPPLDDQRNYRGGGNKGLEALAWHPQYGLIVAPESPLEQQPKTLHTVYANDRHWSFLAHPAKDSRLKALEVLADGNLLALERSSTGATKPLVVSLRYVDIAACPADGTCGAEDLAVFPTGRDNFEGLADLGKHRFLAVSDHHKDDPVGMTVMLFSLQYKDAP